MVGKYYWAEPDRIVYDWVRDGVFSLEVSGILVHPSTDAVVGAVYDSNYPEVLWFDPTYAKIHGLLNRSFPDLFHIILGFSADEDVIFASTGG